ncbi:hypothetical protein LTR66_012042, partial [Elasticomyces elasticus]
MTTSADKPMEVPVVVDNTKATAPPRKRRRRATASGAAEDCFACRKRETACDRKIPYCTQCVDMGKECSGYKTTLTWGVGIASRGKLRGLSCPVITKFPEAGISVAPKAPAAAKRKVSVSKVTKDKAQNIAVATNNISSAPSITMPCYNPGYDYIKREDMTAPPLQSVPIAIPQPQVGWQHAAGFQQRVDQYDLWSGRAGRRTPPHNPNLQRLHTSFATPYGTRGMPASANSMSAFSDNEYFTPTEYVHSPDGVSYPSLLSLYRDPYNAEEAMTGSSVDSQSLHSASIDSYTDAIHSSVSSEHSMRNFMENNSVNAVAGGSESLSEMLYRTQNMVFDSSAENDMLYDTFPTGIDHFPMEDLGVEDINTSNMSLSIPRALFPTPFFYLPLRIQHLLDFYDKAICPVLVAFDSDSNPYRMHVLHLAMQNESLQNAIAALATNNMRMRAHKSVRQIGYVDEISDGSTEPRNPTTLPTMQELGEGHDEPTPEESCYKAMSIDMLNSQLADPRSAQDDSVLATLLILCLFHVCDSGFSKFKTQLAGVQKLLKMRDPSVPSGFIGWIEMFFTWFDVMTSTVNDRETQIQGESLDMLDYSANLGALEQFSGCDGRLFKLIARLGRLNLLSQKRPVRLHDIAERTPRPSPRQNPRTSASGIRAKGKRTKRSFSNLDFANLDGNGWGTPIITSDDEDAPAQCTTTTTATLCADDRAEFWSEWQDIRSRLQSWTMDFSTMPSPPSPRCFDSAAPQIAPEQQDLLHISESFRHSALLYTERLAYPALPSSATNFQTLVTEALRHITALPVTSCVNKFLLWPL